MHKQGRHDVLLTATERQCYQWAQRYRRRVLCRGICSVYRIFWPPILSRLNWSVGAVQRGIQALVLIVLLPVILFWGALDYTVNLILFPFRFMSTFVTPKALRSPGEKSLTGMHHAFSAIMDLPDRYYIRCVDRWVAVLFGSQMAEQYSLSAYIDKAQELQQDSVKAVGWKPLGLRRELVVAREALSRDLGHYLLRAEGPSTSGD